MKYKFSYYNIINEYKDSKLIFSTRSSKLILLKNKLAKNVFENNFEKIEKNLLDTLISYEIIVPEFEDELNEIITQNKDKIDESTTLYQVIQPSANCQLGCGYCGQVHTKDSIKSDYSEKLLLRLENKIKNNPQLNDLSIGWFGAEALMGLKEIKSLTPKLIKLANGNNMSYNSKIVTNGLSLKKDIFLDLVNNYKVTSFEVTLDGTAKYHDKRRYLKSGEKSFDLIVKNLTEIFALENYNELGVTFSIRCNVDKTNYDGVIPLIEELRSLDFHKKVSFYVAPIHSWGNEAHLVSLEKAEFADKEIDWTLALLKNDFGISLLPSRRYETCFAVSPNAELIDSNGDLFNFSEVSQVPAYKDSEYVLGNIATIDSDHVFKDRPLENWNDTILSTETLPCHSCKMLPVCSGACPKSWKEGIVACPSPKSNIKDRMLFYYLAEQKGIEYIKENL